MHYVNSVGSGFKNGTDAYVESRSSLSRADGGIVAREVVLVGVMVELIPSPGEELGLLRTFALKTQTVDKAGPRRQIDVSKRDRMDRLGRFCDEGRGD